MGGVVLGATDPIFFEVRDPDATSAVGMQKPNSEYYYYRSVRNQIIVFMSLFKNMKIVDINETDTDTLNSSTETKIDIVYTPKERKLIEQLYENNDPFGLLDNKVPKFSVSINSITYDQTRALNYFRTRRIKSNSQQWQDRMPIPYDIGINLSILAKYEEHIHQISENIVPYMSPYIIVKIKENITNLELIPRELRIDFDGNVNREIPLEWLETERREVRGNLNFTIRGWIYKPLSEQPGPILTIPIRFFKKEDFDLENSLFDETQVTADDILDSSEITGPNWG